MSSAGLYWDSVLPSEHAENFDSLADLVLGQRVPPLIESKPQLQQKTVIITKVNQITFFINVVTF